MDKEADIFVDVIPGYKIRALDKNAEVEAKSKAVRAVQKIEDIVLQKYEKFLNYILKMRSSQDKVVQCQSYECICKLLSAAAHFNFSSSLISAVVSGCCEKNDDVARMCVAALEELLDLDGSGESSLKALNCATNLIKNKGHTINPALVACFIHMRISAIDVEKQTTEQRKRAHMKEKKKMTDEDKRIQKDLSKAEATPDEVQRRRNMTLILQRLMASYLRVLEVAQQANGIRQHRLLVPVLEGLTKFAPLLDVEMLNLLLTAIKDLLNLSHTHPLTALNAIVACATLTECAEMASVLTNTAGDEFTTSAVAIDFGAAYDHLYRVIPSVLSTPTAADLVSFRRERASTIKKAERKEEDGARLKPGQDAETMSLATSMATTVDLSHEYINACSERNRRVNLLFKACEILLLKPKFLPTGRAAAFAKQLSLYAAHQPPHIAMAIVGMVRQMSQRRSYLADLISESPEGNAGTGVYNPFTDAPDFAHAEGAIMWELCLLAKSYHPTLSRYCNVVQKTAQEARDPLMKRHAGLTNHVVEGVGSLLRSEPSDLLKLHDTSLGNFNPPIQEPPTKKRKLAGPDL
uniref:Nucleolar complex protein 3 homolog n=1 Tax=Eutreptiella gymnastica TaxID=73025 RepID=A0A7S1IMW2_9EUGL